MNEDNLEGFTIKVVIWLPLCVMEGEKGRGETSIIRAPLILELCECTTYSKIK